MKGNTGSLDYGYSGGSCKISSMFVLLQHAQFGYGFPTTFPS